ncbi:MAG: hypothetical protein K1X75_08080 [Leptospirales bacterium]|nr:hypothetical protein [Leptospirales bacterium]
MRRREHRWQDARVLAALCGLLLAALWPGALAADLLRLRSGQSISGFYVEEKEEGVVFVDTSGAERLVPRSEIENLTMGYSGAPVCYQLRDSDQRHCDAILHDVDENKLVIAEGDGYTNLRTIPMEQLASAELTRAQEFQRFSSVLSPGVRVRLQSGNTHIEGVVTGVQAGAVVVQDSRGNEQTLPDDGVAALVVEPHQEPGFEFPDFWALAPGVNQLGGGRNLQGYTMLGGSALAWSLFFIEYRAAVAVSQRAASDPTVIFFYNTAYRGEFQRHQNNQRLLGAAGILLYAWHVVDLWLWQPSANADNLRPSPSLAALDPIAAELQGRAPAMLPLQARMEEGRGLWEGGSGAISRTRENYVLEWSWNANF